jgi:hypothetical protein
MLSCLIHLNFVGIPADGDFCSGLNQGQDKRSAAQYAMDRKWGNQLLASGQDRRTCRLVAVAYQKPVSQPGPLPDPIFRTEALPEHDCTILRKLLEAVTAANGHHMAVKREWAARPGGRLGS